MNVWQKFKGWIAKKNELHRGNITSDEGRIIS